MEQFPEIIDGQVVLLKADINTGIILDHEFNWATPDKKVYTVFNYVDDALKFTKQLMSENTQIECLIYTFDQKVLHYLKPG